MGRVALNGMTVLITGASSGIGKEIARILLFRYGCLVIGTGRSEEKLRAFAAEAEGTAAGRFFWRTFDVGDKAGWEETAAYLKEREMPPDLVVNCAGVLPPFAAYGGDGEGVGRALRTNFLSAVWSAEALSPLLAGNPRARIVNIGSSSSLCPFAGVAAYCASKAALQRFSECVSLENGILVSVFMPGFTDTDVFRSQNFDEGTKGFFRRFGMSPQRMAEKIVRAIARGRRRKIFGADARLMDWGYRLFPRLAPRIITKFLRTAKPDAFGGIVHEGSRDGRKEKDEKKE